MSYDSSPNASASSGTSGMKNRTYLKNALSEGKPGIGMWLT